MLGSNDTAVSQRQRRIAPLTPTIKKEGLRTHRASHINVSTFTYHRLISGLSRQAPQIEMACVRRLAVALIASFLVAAVGAQPMDPNQPNNPFMSDPNVIPVYMSPGSPPTYVSCYNDTHGQQGSEPSCSVLARQCPRGCRDTCYVHCPSCKLVCLCELTGTECYDPRFVGGDGNKFLFHGRRDADFCLLSDANLHINAHFIGKRNARVARDFTWVQALGIRFGGHRLYLGARRTGTWDDAVDRLAITFDGAPVPLDAGVAGASWSPTSSAPALSIFRTGPANGVVVRLDGVFRIVANAVPVTEEDSRAHGYGLGPEDGSLAHLNVAFKFYAISADVHGVLGQTYRPDYVSAAGVDAGARVPVMGGAARYEVSGIFATDCEVGRFAGEDGLAGPVGIIEEPTDALCGSGKVSTGLVCKK